MPTVLDFVPLVEKALAYLDAPDQEIDQRDVNMQEALRLVGIEGFLSCGTVRSALISDHVVVKWKQPRSRNGSDQSEMEDELKLFEQLRNLGYIDNIPETYLARYGDWRVHVQEKLMDVGACRVEMKAYNLARIWEQKVRRNFTNDMHPGQYGVRSFTSDEPVIFDLMG